MSAALELARSGVPVVVFDRNDRPGGLARTVWHNGYGFDLGPHRFYTKNLEVEQLWQDLLGRDLLEIHRQTRIFYGGRFFSYPLRPLEALARLGPLTSAHALGSYARERFRRRKDPVTFEDWTRAQFGSVLYEIFFRGYTEKVWGIPCSEISNVWAQQRIKGLSLGQAARRALVPRRSTSVRSLVERFYYPRLGAGQLYERMAEEVIKLGGSIRYASPVERMLVRDSRVIAIESEQERHETQLLFSSAPLTWLPRAITPALDKDLLEAANSLRYRAHITVNLTIDGAGPFPDNWIYLNSPEVKAARIANYASFSPDLAPEPQTTGISVEYFAFVGDSVWQLDDKELITLACCELAKLGFADTAVSDGFVIREPDAYPTYYLGYEQAFARLYSALAKIENLILIGRAGMYRYDNQDHAILSGLYAARNALGKANVDLRQINTEHSYLEEAAPTGRARSSLDRPSS
jgi:protoporphyrinogen oxidase